jgi:hypothetical protein
VKPEYVIPNIAAQATNSKMMVKANNTNNIGLRNISASFSAQVFKLGRNEEPNILPRVPYSLIKGLNCSIMQKISVTLAVKISSAGRFRVLAKIFLKVSIMDESPSLRKYTDLLYHERWRLSIEIPLTFYPKYAILNLTIEDLGRGVACYSEVNIMLCQLVQLATGPDYRESQTFGRMKSFVSVVGFIVSFYRRERTRREEHIYETLSK